MTPVGTQTTSRQLTDLIPEGRINRLISASMDRNRDSISTMFSQQISSAFRNVYGVQSGRETRDDLRYDKEGQAAPAFRRQSNAAIPEFSFGGRMPCISFGHSEIDRPDRISNTISMWRRIFTGSPNDLPLETTLNFALLSQFAYLLFSGPALL